MARKSNVEPLQKALNPQDQPERFRLGEISSSGLNIFSGIPQEELRRELDFPNNIKTYKQMSYHPSVNASVSLYCSMIAKANYRVVAPENASEEEKNRAKVISQMLFEDMEHPFEDVIQDAATFLVYGFSVSEKVYRKRELSSGSKFNDGLIAPKKITIRHQSSIEKFIFSEDGNEVKGVKQTILSDTMGRFSNRTNTVVIPRSKFLLFTAGGTSDNPYGISPLRNVYIPYKYLSAIEELEAQGVQKELTGVPVLKVPAQYMSADASPEQKAIFENMKNIVRNLQQGSQAGVVLPSTVDPETRVPLFSLELLAADGKRGYNLTEIKEYYRNLIFTGLGTDVLLLGSSSSTGSFALASVKNTITGQVVESYLKRIIRVINDDLIKQIYFLNNWPTDRMCKVDYENLSEVDLESYSKAIQRMLSTSGIPVTLDVVNRNLDMIGVDRLPESTTKEELKEMLPNYTSRSGDGFRTPFEGTRTSQGIGNDNDSNLDNVG